MIAVHVTDLSIEGCSLASEELIPIGERLTLQVEPLKDVSAIVRWSLSGKAGLRFANGDWM